MPRCRPIRCAATRTVSLPTSGTSTSGRSSSKIRSSARKWATVRRDAPLLGAAGADPVGPVDVADVRDVVGRLDPRDLGVERRPARRAAAIASIRQRAFDAAARAGAAPPRARRSRATVSWPRALELGADAAVEVALVGLECREEEAHQSSAAARSSRKRAGECSRTTCSRPRLRIVESVPASAEQPRPRRRQAPPGRSRRARAPPPESSSSCSGPPHGVDSTGTPEASASAATMPKPSCHDGRTKSAASRRTSATEATSPSASAPSGRLAGGRPTSRSRASGTRRRISGQAASRSAAFLRGSSARPTKTTVGAASRARPRRRAPARTSARRPGSAGSPTSSSGRPGDGGDGGRGSPRSSRRAARRRARPRRSSRRSIGAFSHWASRRPAVEAAGPPPPLRVQRRPEPGPVRPAERARCESVRGDRRRHPDVAGVAEPRGEPLRAAQLSQRLDAVGRERAPPPASDAGRRRARAPGRARARRPGTRGSGRGCRRRSGDPARRRRDVGMRGPSPFETCAIMATEGSLRLRRLSRGPFATTHRRGRRSGGSSHARRTLAAPCARM